MTRQRTAASLLILLFGALSIGANTDGCVGSSQPPTPDCCPTGQQHYVCSVSVRVADVVLMGDGNGPGVETRCFAAPPACASSAQNAQDGASAQAKSFYFASGSKTVIPLAVQCAPAAVCIGGGATPQSEPLDMPGACGSVIVPADGGVSCMSPSGACTADTDCCAGVCSEMGACESCRMSSEGCVDDAECCSGICSLNACGG